ncbi:MAG: hypothetical protein ACFFCW_12215 [Candidatus Hodarchaeota archaeon]
MVSANEFKDASKMNTGRNALFKTASIAAVLSVIIIPLSAVLFLMYPAPESVAGWFAQFQENKIIGLIQFDFLYVLVNLLLIPIVITFWFLLRRLNESMMVVAMVLVVIAIPALLISRPMFDFIHLSNQYAAATSDAVRSHYLAAGEVMLAMFNGTGYHMHLILGVIGYLIISVLMLKSPYFRKSTAYMGILGNVLTWGFYIPKIGIAVLLFSVIFFEAWMILLALDFFKLVKTNEKNA